MAIFGQKSGPLKYEWLDKTLASAQMDSQKHRVERVIRKLIVHCIPDFKIFLPPE